jgi:Txe/YoeB family toxin of Txe-Axe toxin-antitoxin module
VILSKPVQNIKDELDEDKKHQQEKERIDKMLWTLKQDPVKWKQTYESARSEIPQNQLDL